MKSNNIYKVGNTVVHSNQIEASMELCDKLLDGPTHLTAGCQSGKTGVVIHAINQFLTGFDIDCNKLLRYIDKDKDFNTKMSKTQIIWINARSDNYLRDQTEDRLIGAFGKNKILTRESISRKRTLIHNDMDKKGKLIGKIYIGHSSDLQIDNNDNLVQLKNVIDFNEPILLILDESHVGQDKFSRKMAVSKDGKISEYNIGVLDNFCKNLGIYLRQPKDKWDPRRYFLSMSATRPSFSVYIEEFKENFGQNYIPQIVHLHPSDNYCGIAKDYNNVTAERFVQSDPFYNNKTQRVSSQIINEVRSLPFGKCVLIRGKLQESDMIIKSLKKQGFEDKENGDYAYAQCGIHYSTADSLNQYLSDCSESQKKKMVIFIENFLGAGATFPNVRIHAQFERHNKSNPTAHIQSVGRSFGYSDEYTDENGDIKVFNKKDSTYKIYCDLPIMKLYEDGFDTDIPVYRDSATKTDSKRNRYKNNWVIETVDKVPNENIGVTLQNYFKKKFVGKKEFDNFIAKTNNSYSVHMAYTKTTNFLDICKLIIDKKYIDNDERQSLYNKVACIDGGNPDHENPFIGHSNSYDVLMENISKGTSRLCNENTTVNTFETKYVCVYVHKKSNTTDTKNYKMKADKILSIV